MIHCNRLFFAFLLLLAIGCGGKYDPATFQDGGNHTRPVGITSECAQNSYKALQSLWTPMPKHLENRDCVRESSDFDVSRYFTALPHIRMEDGYVLDYVYHFDGMGGYPIFYARKKEAPAFASEKERSNAIDRREVIDWIPRIQADDSPEGYFELTLLAVFGQDFYLYWHAISASKDFVYDQESLKNATRNIPSTTKFDARKARKLDLRPTVTFSEDKATVVLYTFSAWAGIDRNTYCWNRNSPSERCESRRENVIPFDCNIIF